MGAIRKDIARNLDSGLSISPASITATTIGSEVGVVGKGPHTVLLVVAIGAVASADASNYQTFTVNQCTESGGTFVAADADQYDWVEGDGIINATTEADSVMTLNFRLKPGYDYLKAIATETGTTEAIFGAVFLKPGRHNPVAT